MAFWNIHQLRMERNYQKNGMLIILVQLYLIGGLEHGFYDCPYIGNDHPIWLSYFSEGQVYQPDILWISLNV